MLRIDTHHHMVPPDYRKDVAQAGIDEAGGRAVPDWSPEGSLQTMAELDVATAILSVSTPGTTFLPEAADAAALARDLNDYGAGVVAAQPDRFGFFATLPMPHLDESVTEAVRALDDLHADGVVLLANNAGTYLGEDGQDALFAALDARSAVVFIHPADLPGPAVPGVLPFAADFLLDTTRAAYLLVRNGIRRKVSEHPVHPEPCRRLRALCVHRMAIGITSDTGQSSPTSSMISPGSTSTPRCRRPSPPCPRCWPSPNPDTSPSDPTTRSHRSRAQLFAAGLESYPGLDTAGRTEIDRTNALRLFPRLGAAPQPISQSPMQRVRHVASRAVMRGVARLANTS